MAYKGKYTPKNRNKYLGNPHKVIYRSLWERKFMVYCDNNNRVLEWASEEIVIPYTHPDGKRRRYFPDFYTKIKTDSGKIKEYVVEIKPKRQVMKPKAKKGITKSYITEANTWMMNQSKWEAAERYCKARNWEFMILTEDDIL